MDFDVVLALSLACFRTLDISVELCGPQVSICIGSVIFFCLPIHPKKQHASSLWIIKNSGPKVELRGLTFSIDLPLSECEVISRRHGKKDDLDVFLHLS